jgi:hypothetical protein
MPSTFRGEEGASRKILGIVIDFHLTRARVKEIRIERALGRNRPARAPRDPK